MMETSLERIAKVRLIQMAKVFPFVLCGFIAILYTECFVSLVAFDVVNYKGYYILNTPLNFFVANYYEYSTLTIIGIGILAFALETCMWNKLCVYYAAFNLLEKYLFTSEISLIALYAIVVLNIIVSSYLAYKGVRILTGK